MAVNFRAWIAEFLGTMFLCIAVNSTIFLKDGSILGVFGIALMLMQQIYCLGPVSGGHLNPAVTLAAIISGKLKGALDCAMYPLFQILGGITGCSLVLMIAPEKVGQSNVFPQPGYQWYDAVVHEFIFTFMLCSVVLNVACTERNAGNQYFALAIGFVILAAGAAAGGISGGAFNPAVALGKDLASLIFSDSAKATYTGFKFCSLYYLGAELAGAALAALAFRGIRPEEFGEEAKAKVAENGPSLLSRLMAEFLGTFLLTYTAYLILSQGVVGGTVSISAALTVLVYCFGTCSGGHLNPAVTVAIAVAGRDLISVRDIFLYIAVQLVAGFCAVMGAAGLQVNALKKSVGVDVLDESNGLGAAWAQRIVVEILFTMLLGYVVLSAATTKNAYKDMFGFIIGSVVVMGFFGGAGLNPAVMMNLDVAHAIFRKDTEVKFAGHGFLCMGLELVAGAIAGGLFRAFRPEEYPKKGEETEEAPQTEDEEAPPAAEE